MIFTSLTFLLGNWIHWKLWGMKKFLGHQFLLGLVKAWGQEEDHWWHSSFILQHLKLESGPAYILKIPNSVSGMGALRAVLMDSPRTCLVSTGSMIPSSHNLWKGIRELIQFYWAKQIFSNQGLRNIPINPVLSSMSKLCWASKQIVYPVIPNHLCLKLTVHLSSMVNPLLQSVW